MADLVMRRSVKADHVGSSPTSHPALAYDAGKHRIRRTCTRRPAFERVPLG